MADANKVAAIKKAIETDGKYKGRKWSPAQLRNMLAMAEGKKLGGGKRKKGKKSKKATTKKAAKKTVKKVTKKAAKKTARKTTKRTTKKVAKKAAKKATRKTRRKTTKKVAKAVTAPTAKPRKKGRRKTAKKTSVKSVVRILGRHVNKPPKGDMTKKRAKRTVVHVAITADDIIGMSKHYHLKRLICGGKGK